MPGSHSVSSSDFTLLCDVIAAVARHSGLPGDEAQDFSQHVHLRLPGMAGSTVQLRFEYTQDGAATCADTAHAGDCGVAVDNLVVKNVLAVKP